MTIIVGIAVYIFGAVSGVFFTSLIVAGKKMDEVMRMEDEENE